MDTLTLSLSVLLIILCLGALWFYSYAIYGAIDYLTHANLEVDSEFHPRVTLLKPLCGADSDTYLNLLSFCQQDYPHYQIVFAVQDLADPSVEVVQKLMQNFPEQDIQLVVSNQAVGSNPRVNHWANAAAVAKYGLWVLADDDIRVGKDYLQRIVQPFRYPGVGVVTCPYRSQAQGWVAILEALGAATELHPNALVARRLEGIHFALGSTIAIRKDLLDKLGGFEVIADYVADDFQLGALPATLGYRVVLSNYVVEQHLSNDSFWAVLQRQTSWARGLRASRPLEYVGRMTTYGTVASLLLLVVTGGSALGWTFWSLTWVARLAMAAVVGVGCLQDAATKRYWWLLPIYDLISFAVWCRGLLGNTVIWQGQRFHLLPGGQLTRNALSPKNYPLPVLEKI